MTNEDLARLTKATEVFSHHRHALMAAGGNPYETWTIEELQATMAVICALAQAASEECSALSLEMQRRQEP